MKKQPEIPLYLQDFIDMVFLMQTRVIPRYEKLSALKIDYKRRLCFTLVEKEYLETVNAVVAKIDPLYSVWEKRIGYNEKKRKGIFFFRMAVRELQYLFPPNPHDLLTPNRIDLSMLEKMPYDRLTRAAGNLTKLFTRDAYGRLVYQPEMIKQNPFVVFRDCRLSANTVIDWSQDSAGESIRTKTD